MIKPENLVSYSSISNTEKESKFHYIDDYNDSSWSLAEGKITYPSVSKLNQDYFDQYPRDDIYDSGEDSHNFTNKNGLPKVNLKNILTELVAIVTGHNQDNTNCQVSSSGVSFLGKSKNGETFLHSSVCIPSAPPLLDSSAYIDVLEAEPPEWLPDSSSTGCKQCMAPFTALTRGRHHCRFCWGIFCQACSKGRSLMPLKFRERNPQRVCDTCYDRLDPLQGVLINTISNVVQAAKHDVMDWTCARGWLNLPVGFSMEHEIYKACSTLRSYNQVNQNPKKSIPSSFLKDAKGFAILTVAKAGVLLSYKMGSGLVVARRSVGSWSPPSAIVSVGLGWGAQAGGGLMDFIIVLHDSKAVKTFCSRMHFSLEAGCSAAAGPVRRVEADLQAGDGGSGLCYTYSCSKGTLSQFGKKLWTTLEITTPSISNIDATRMDTNLKFYGDPYTTNDILLGAIERPEAAEPLYYALRGLYSKL